eukprot:g3823.t1
MLRMIIAGDGVVVDRRGGAVDRRGGLTSAVIIAMPWLWVAVAGVGGVVLSLWWLMTDPGSAPPPKVVLVTGASGGLGQVLQQALQKQFKHAVVVGTSRKGVSPKQWSPQSNELISLDVTNDASVDAAVSAIQEKAGPIDVLVNNAGIAFHSLAHCTASEDAQRVFDTNFFGPIRMVRAVAPGMQQRKQGCIINLGSIAGRIGMPYMALYSASKAALANYTDALKLELLRDNLELLRDNVRVACVEPGDFAPGQVNTFHSKDFKFNPIAVQVEQIMRANEAKGPPPTKVVATVLSAVRAARPKSRYIVGSDAWLVWTGKRFLPRSLQQYLVMDEYKIPSK